MPGPSIEEALADTPAVLVVGARQAGKTTLWPLSQGELTGRRETFLDRVMRGEPPARVAGDEDLLG